MHTCVSLHTNLTAASRADGYFKGGVPANEAELQAAHTTEGVRGQAPSWWAEALADACADDHCFEIF